MTNLLLFNAALVVAGVGLLWIGGELLLRGAVAFSLRHNMSRAMVGLTVVAIGTSLPELCVSLISLFSEGAALSVANLLGSNIINTALILPITALIRPLAATPTILTFDLPMMLVATAITLLLFMEWPIGSWATFGAIHLSAVDGSMLLALLLLYFVLLIIRHRRQSAKNHHTIHMRPLSGTPLPSWMLLLFLALGIVGLQSGAYLLVRGASTIAAQVGISRRVIGLTVVALGTSLPELFASLVALAKRENEIILGNIVGSNIINALLIFGMLGVVQGVGIAASDAFGVDIIALVAISLVLSATLYLRAAIRPPLALFLLLCYGAYSALLFYLRS